MLICRVFFFLSRCGLHLDRSSVSFYFCLHLPPWTKSHLDLVYSFAFPSAVVIDLCQLLVVPTIFRLRETASSPESMVCSGGLLSLGLVLLAGQFGCSLTLRHKGFIKVEQSESILLSELLWCLTMSMWNKTIFHRTQLIWLPFMLILEGQWHGFALLQKKLQNDSF